MPEQNVLLRIRSFIQERQHSRDLPIKTTPSRNKDFMSIKDASFLEEGLRFKIRKIPNRELGLEALEIAKQAHANQQRREGVPYIVHPLRIMHRMIDFYQKEHRQIPMVAIAICLLHDILEDSSINPDELIRRLGKNGNMSLAISVVEGVKSLSKIIRYSNSRRFTTDYEYFNSIRELPYIIREIKVFDRIDNLLALFNEPLDDPELDDIEREKRRENRIKQIVETEKFFPDMAKHVPRLFRELEKAIAAVKTDTFIY